jgi:CheY-like chemotaxis protein
MSYVLKMLGHHVTVVKDGFAALEAVIEHCPDVAILDIGLPDMSGYELAGKLRASGVCPDSMKLIALTGYAEDMEALATAGFDNYMTKPADLARLEGILDSIIPTKA